MLLFQYILCLLLLTIKPITAETTTTTGASSNTDLYGRTTDPASDNCWPVDSKTASSITSPTSFTQVFNTLKSSLVDPYFTTPLLNAMQSSSYYTVPANVSNFDLGTNAAANFNRVKNVMGQLQALASLASQYATSDQLAASDFALDANGSYVSGGTQPPTPALAYLYFILYFYLYTATDTSNTAIAPIYNAYPATMQSQISTAMQILLYMLTKKTTNDVASYDLANNQNSSLKTIQALFPIDNTSSVQYTADPRFIIRISMRVINTNGSLATSDWQDRHGYLTISSDGGLYCDENAHYSSRSFFKVVQHPAGGTTIALQAPAVSANYLADTDPVALKIDNTWVKEVEKKVSRLTLGATSLSATDGSSAFQLYTVSGPIFAVQSMASPTLVNHTATDGSGDPQGFWFIESDHFVRSYLSSGAGYSAHIANPLGDGTTIICTCTAEFVGAFATQLAGAMDAPTLTAKLQQFQTLFNTTSLTKPQLATALAQLQTVFATASTIQADWQTLVDQKDKLIIPMLRNIRNTYYSAWPKAGSTNDPYQILVQLLGTNLGPNDTTNTVAVQTDAIKAGDLITKYISNISISSFATVNFAASISILTNRFTTLDASGLDQFLKDIEGLICVGVNPILPTSSIVEAFSTDLAQLTNTNKTGILDILSLRLYFQNADSANADSSKNGQYSARVNKIIAAINQNIPVETYFANLQNFVLSNPTFTAAQIDLFIQKLDRIVSSRSTALDPIGLVQNTIKLVNTVIYNQLQSGPDDKRAKLLAYNKTLSGTLASAGIMAESYANRVNEVINIANDPTFNSTKLPTLLDNIRSLVADRIDAAQADINNLSTFLTALATGTQNAVVFFGQDLSKDPTGKTTALQTINDLNATLLTAIPFADRLKNLNNFVQNNAPSRFITTTTGGQATLNPNVDVIAAFAIPFMDKLQFMVNSRATAAASDLAAVPPLINFAKSNQLRLSLGTQVPSGTFQGRTIQDALDYLYSGLTGALSYDTLTYSGKVAYLANMLNNAASSQFVPQDFCQKLSDLVAAKVQASASDLQQLINIVTGAGYKDNLKGINFKNIPMNTFLSGLQSSLNTPLTINDYQNYLNIFATSTANMTIDQQNDFIAKATALSNLQSSINSTNYKPLLDTINYVKFNKIPVALQPSLDAVVAMLQQRATITLTSILDQINTLSSQITALTPSQTQDAATIIQTSIPNILKQKISASQAEMTAMANLLKLVRWNTVIATPSLSFIVTGLDSSLPSGPFGIADIVDKVFTPYLAKPAAFAELLTTLNNLYDTYSSKTTLDANDAPTFLSTTKALTNALGQATLDQLSSAQALLNKAIYNKMSSIASDLTAHVNKISDMVINKTPAATSALIDFSTLRTTFANDFSNLTSNNLANAIKNFQTIVNNKAYALAADLQAVIDFVNSETFNTHTVIMQGGKDQFSPLIATLTTQLQFMDHYGVLKDLQRRATANPPTTLSDYYIQVLNEKLAILATNATELYNNKIAYDDVRYLIIALTKTQQFSAGLSAANVFTSTTDLLAKIRAGMRAQEQFSVPFATRIQTASQMGLALQNTQNASDFYDYINALTKTKAEGSSSDINTLIGIIQQVMYANIKLATSTTDFATLLNTALGVANAQDLINSVVTNLSTAVTNNDRVTWLLNILKTTSMASHHPDLIVRVFTDFMTNINSDASGNQSLALLQTACQRALATTFAKLPQANQINTLLTNLNTMLAQQTTVQTSLQVQQLQSQLNSLGTDLTSLQGFLSSAINCVNQYLDLSDTDIQTLIKILNALQFKSAYTSNLNIVYNDPTGTITDESIKEIVSGLINDLGTQPTFLERLENVQKFYNNMDTSTASLNTFLDKAKKTATLRSSDLVRKIDDDGDKIYTFIVFLNNAAANKMAAMQKNVSVLVNDLTSYRNGIKATLPDPFSLSIANIKNSFKNLTSNDIPSFISAVQTLTKSRAQGTTKDLTDFCNWLQSDKVLKDPKIYAANISQKLTDLANTFTQPIDVTTRYNELQRMTSTYGTGGFSTTQKSEFYSKISELAGMTSQYKSANLDKGAVLDIIGYAQNSVYDQADIFTSSVGTTEHYLDNLVNLKAILQNYNPTASLGVYFGDQLNSVINSLSLVGNDAQKAKDFVNALQNLANSIVDALPADITNFTNFLTTNQILKSGQTAEVIYAVMGRSFAFINQILTQIDPAKTPITYTDRINNFNAFVSSAHKPFTDREKEVCIAKMQVLFQYRGDAAAAKFDLSTLPDLFNLIASSRFDQNLDTALIKNINDFASKITLPAQASGPQNYDFSVDIQTLIASFAKVKDDASLNDFISKITDVATRRSNAIYVNDSDTEDQIQTLYAGLFVDPNDTTSKLNINSNDFIYFNADRKQKITTSVQALIQTVKFADRFTSLYNFTQQYTDFDAPLGSTSPMNYSKVSDLFLKLLKRTVRAKADANQQNFNKQDLVDLLNKIISNRTQDISTENAIKQQISLFTNADDTSTTYRTNYFTTALAAFMKNYFGGVTADAAVAAKTSPSYTTKPLDAFVSDVEKLVANRNDATAAEFSSLQSLLDGISVKSDFTLINNKTLKDRYDAAAKLMETAASFADLAGNLISMITSLATFQEPANANDPTISDSQRFLAKLRRVVDNRGDGYNSGYDMDRLISYVQVVLATQMKNDQRVLSLYNALQTRPKSTAADNYTTFVTQLAAQKTAYAALPSDPSYKTTVANWVDKLQPLVKNRIAGVTFNTTNKTEDTSVLEDFAEFLDNTVRYQDLIMNLPPEAVLDRYLTTLKSPATFTDLVTSFTTIANTASIFSVTRRNDFINQLDRIVARRSAATADQINTISRVINSVKNNRFQTIDEGAFLNDYLVKIKSSASPTEQSYALRAETTALLVVTSEGDIVSADAANTAGAATQAPDISPPYDANTTQLATDISTMEKTVSSINPTLSTVTDAQRIAWVNIIKPLVYKLKAALGSYTLLGAPYKDYASRSLDAAQALKNRALLNTPVQEDFDNTVINPLKSMTGRTS